MKKEQDLQLAVIILASSIALVATVLGVMVHLHRSLVQAVNTMALCQHDNPNGGCKIERDGYEYNVYWEEL